MKKLNLNVDTLKILTPEQTETVKGAGDTIFGTASRGVTTGTCAN